MEENTQENDKNSEKKHRRTRSNLDNDFPKFKNLHQNCPNSVKSSRKSYLLENEEIEEEFSPVDVNFEKAWEKWQVSRNYKDQKENKNIKKKADIPKPPTLQNGVKNEMNIVETLNSQERTQEPYKKLIIEEIDEIKEISNEFINLNFGKKQKILELQKKFNEKNKNELKNELNNEEKLKPELNQKENNYKNEEIQKKVYINKVKSEEDIFKTPEIKENIKKYFDSSLFNKNLYNNNYFEHNKTKTADPEKKENNNSHTIANNISGISKFLKRNKGGQKSIQIKDRINLIDSKTSFESNNLYKDTNFKSQNSENKLANSTKKNEEIAIENEMLKQKNESLEKQNFLLAKSLNENIKKIEKRMDGFQNNFIKIEDQIQSINRKLDR